MCLSSRLRRFSGLFSLFAFSLAVYVAFFKEERPCEGKAAPPRPSAAPPAPRALNLSALPPGPSAAPAINECALPLDVMAPTTRPSPTAYPSMRPVPSAHPGDEALAALRAAAARRHTSQCFQVISDQLANASARLVYCDDFARAVAEGSRAHRDGPFQLRCPTVWFTPAEACQVLQAIGKLVVFVGDSIGRQLQQGLFSVLTGS